MNLKYTPAQEQVFFQKHPAKFTIVTKGRRVGLTRGAAQAFVEYAVTNPNTRLLWGETIYSNVQRYVDLYFMPLLEQLPIGTWQWHSKMMQLQIMGSVIDFRSADSPETWEGFAYHKIFLNEAGIILKNPDLFKKTVLPMLMDFADSQLIAAGVPKGKKLRSGDVHPFFELWEKSLSTPGYARYKFSSHDNPFLRPQDIKDIEEALDDSMILQEIYGEFVDLTDNPYLYAFEPDNHIMEVEYVPSLKDMIWLSFDFNIEPNSCIIGQQNLYTRKSVVFDEVSVKGSTEEVCKVILSKYGHWIKRGMFYITGDATGKNRNAMSGEITNYKIIKTALMASDTQFKVRHTNMEVKASRVLCNSVLSRVNIQIQKRCAQLITDCQLATVDGSGELIKDKGLHKFDCFRYIIEAWYPDFLDKDYKYV